MTHRLTTNYAKNYCNRTLAVKVIVENVVACFSGTQCIYTTFFGPVASIHSNVKQLHYSPPECTVLGHYSPVDMEATGYTESSLQCNTIVLQHIDYSASDLYLSGGFYGRPLVQWPTMPQGQ